MTAVRVTLSRAHKVAERIKLLIKEATDEAVLQSRQVTVQNRLTQRAVMDIRARGPQVMAKAANITELVSAHAVVREAIARANVEHGVSSVLASMEAANRAVELYGRLLGQATVPAGALTPVELETYVHEPQTAVVVSVMAEQRAALEELLAAAKKTVLRYSDDLADLNAQKISFELPDSIAETVVGA